MNQSAVVEQILAGWPPDQPGLAAVFRNLAQDALALPGCTAEAAIRPGVSRSFRASVQNPERSRPVFFLVDVVVLQSDPWFLSVCYYEDEITDPDGLGNPIPQGLFDETGYCFDVEEQDPDLEAYLKKRLTEAHRQAAG